MFTVTAAWKLQQFANILKAVVMLDSGDKWTIDLVDGDEERYERWLVNIEAWINERRTVLMGLTVGDEIDIVTQYTVEGRNYEKWPHPDVAYTKGL